MSTWQVKRNGFQVTGSISKAGKYPMSKTIWVEYDERDTKPVTGGPIPFTPPRILVVPEDVDGLIEALQQVKASLDAVTLE